MYEKNKKLLSTLLISSLLAAQSGFTAFAEDSDTTSLTGGTTIGGNGVVVNDSVTSDTLGGTTLGGETLGGETLGGETLGGDSLGGTTLGGDSLGGTSLGGDSLGGDGLVLGGGDDLVLGGDDTSSSSTEAAVSATLKLSEEIISVTLSDGTTLTTGDTVSTGDTIYIKAKSTNDNGDTVYGVYINGKTVIHDMGADTEGVYASAPTQITKTIIGDSDTAEITVKYQKVCHVAVNGEADHVTILSDQYGPVNGKTELKDGDKFYSTVIYPFTVTPDEGYIVDSVTGATLESDGKYYPTGTEDVVVTVSKDPAAVISGSDDDTAAETVESVKLICDDEKVTVYNKTADKAVTSGADLTKGAVITVTPKSSSDEIVSVSGVTKNADGTYTVDGDKPVEIKTASESVTAVKLICDDSKVTVTLKSENKTVTSGADLTKGAVITIKVKSSSNKISKVVGATANSDGSYTVSGDSDVEITTAAKSTTSSTGTGSSGGSSGGSSSGSSSSSSSTTTTTDAATVVSGASSGSTATITLGSDTTVSASVLKTAASKNLTLNIKVNDTFSWTLDTTKLTSTTAIDFAVGSANVSSAVINNNVGGNKDSALSFSLATASAAASPAVLNANVGKTYAGEFANLYKQNADGTLTFVGVTKIDANGNAVLDVNSSGTYTVVVSKETKMLGDFDNNMGIDARDSSALMKEIITSVETGAYKGDYNNDGIVNALDASAILKYLVGKK